MELTNYNICAKPTKVKIAEEFKSSAIYYDSNLQLSFDTASIKVAPDSNCPHCQGFGHVKEEEGLVECLCVLRKRAIKYLSPHYANAIWDHSFDPTPYKNKNILLQKISINEYKNIVKSFLLSANMLGRKASEEVPYQTVTAYRLLINYFSNSTTFEFSKLETIPFLIISLCSETPNKLYGIIIRALIEKRIFNNVPTWIYSIDGIDSERFEFFFGKELPSFIKSCFVEIQNRKK